MRLKFQSTFVDTQRDLLSQVAIRIIVHNATCVSFKELMLRTVRGHFF